MFGNDRLDLLVGRKTAFARGFDAPVDAREFCRRRVISSRPHFRIDFKGEFRQHVLRVLWPRFDAVEGFLRAFAVMLSI